MGVDYELPVCPACSEECETIYKIGDAVIGCDRCVDAVDAYDYLEQRRMDAYAAAIDRAFEDRRDRAIEEALNR